MEKAETNKILLDVFERLKLVCSRFTELNGVIWDKVGHPLLTTLTDNPQTLIDFLQQEYHANHTIDPLIEKLREKLIEVGDIFWHQEYYDSQELYESYFDLVSECRTWQKWIDQYYPPEQSKQEQDNEEPIKQDEDLRSCFLVQDDKKNELLKKLHLLIDGKKGKPVALVIHLCVELGLMRKPTFGVLKAEFLGIGNKSGFHKYYDRYETSYTKEEKDGLKRHFEPFLEYI